MIDTDKCEGHTCKWCGYVEDTHAWHYEECPIFDDPMMKHHIAEVERLRKRDATFDEFIDSLDVHNEHEWMLIERIDEIHERLHGGEEE